MEKPESTTKPRKPKARAAVETKPPKAEKTPKTRAARQAAKSPEKPKRAAKPRALPAPDLFVDPAALKKLRLVAVAYSNVEREWFPTDEAYEAEREVEERAQTVMEELAKLGINARTYPGDQYFLTNLLVDRPDLVLNLVDTLRGRDYLQTSVPGALELANIPYTGADMRGLVIGNDRNMFKQLLVAASIPTPDFQFIQRKGTKVRADLGLPLIVKLNESGGSVGIDNAAVKETLEDAQAQVDDLLSTYKIPVIVERFVDGPEITAVVFDDGQKKHVFLGRKVFHHKPDGKHEFTSLESYGHKNPYDYAPLEDADLVRRIEEFAVKAFGVLHNKDYSKFDIRVDEATGTPYFTDCNPNTAFGPNLGLPFTEILKVLYGVPFERVLASLMSKYARKIEA